MECPKCHTRSSGGARLCRNCGGPLLEPAAVAATDVVALVPPDAGVRVCTNCGLCVPARKARCEACAKEPVVVAPRADGAYWVRVRCTYQCAGCKSRVPFSAFADDGRSACGLCGHVQDQALLFWRQVLKHAHAVGDLAGPAPDGRLSKVPLGARNPYRFVGLDVAELDDERVREDDDTAGDLAAGPGHPLCLACHVPIDAAWSGGDATCACGVSVHGVKPAKALPIDRGLVAILRRTVVAPAKGALVALRCPTCDAPLTVAEDATRVTCKFCQTTSALAMPAARADRPATESACWMLFSGPSKRRAELESKSA